MEDDAGENVSRISAQAGQKPAIEKQFYMPDYPVYNEGVLKMPRKEKDENQENNSLSFKDITPTFSFSMNGNLPKHLIKEIERDVICY